MELIIMWIESTAFLSDTNSTKSVQTTQVTAKVTFECKMLTFFILYTLLYRNAHWEDNLFANNTEKGFL